MGCINWYDSGGGTDKFSWLTFNNIVINLKRKATMETISQIFKEGMEKFNSLTPEERKQLLEEAEKEIEKESEEVQRRMNALRENRKT